LASSAHYFSTGKLKKLFQKMSSAFTDSDDKSMLDRVSYTEGAMMATLVSLCASAPLFVLADAKHRCTVAGSITTVVQEFRLMYDFSRFCSLLQTICVYTLGCSALCLGIGGLGYVLQKLGVLDGEMDSGILEMYQFGTCVTVVLSVVQLAFINSAPAELGLLAPLDKAVVKGFVAFAVLVSFFIAVVHCTWHLWLSDSLDHDNDGTSSDRDGQVQAVRKKSNGADGKQEAAFSWTWEDEKGNSSRNWSNIIEVVSFTFVWITVTAVTFRPNLPWGNNGVTGGTFWESFGDGLLLSIMEFQWASVELKRRAFHIGFWVSILIAGLMPKLGLEPLRRAKKAPVLAEVKTLAGELRWTERNRNQMDEQLQKVENKWDEAKRQSKRDCIWIATGERTRLGDLCNIDYRLVEPTYPNTKADLAAMMDYDAYKWQYRNFDARKAKLAEMQADVRQTKDGVNSDTAKLTEVLATGIYMVVVKQIMAGFACTHVEGGIATLDQDPAMACYEGRHWAYMLFGALAFLVYYPMSVLTKPFYQAMDAKLEINYNPTFMFLLLQLETALAVAVVFFPKEPTVALPMTVVVDGVLAWWYFAHPPCTIESFNLAARALFSFSACATASSMVAHFAGNDFVASLLLFACTILILGVTAAKLWTARKGRKEKEAALEEDTVNPLGELKTRGPQGIAFQNAQATL
jgi:hypothetical protein